MVDERRAAARGRRSAGRRDRALRARPSRRRARGRRCCRRAPFGRRAAFHSASRAGVADEERRSQGAAFGRVRAPAKRSAVRERLLDGSAVAVRSAWCDVVDHVMPLGERVDEAVPGSQRRRPRRARASSAAETAVSGAESRCSPAAIGRGRAVWLAPTIALDQGVHEPEEAEREQERGDRRDHRPSPPAYAAERGSAAR